jgi:hypothetical protein
LARAVVLDDEARSLGTAVRNEISETGEQQNAGGQSEGKTAEVHGLNLDD